MEQPQPSEELSTPFPIETLKSQLAMFDQIAESSGAMEEAPMLTKIVRLSLDGIVSQLDAANEWILEFVASFDDYQESQEALEMVAAILAVCHPLRSYEDTSPKDLKKLLKEFNERLDLLLGGSPFEAGELETDSSSNGKDQD
jgi:hypothetical protein